MMRMPIVLGMMPAKHPRTRTTSERLLSSLVENFVEEQLNQDLVWVGCEGCSYNDVVCLGGCMCGASPHMEGAGVEGIHTWTR